MAVAIPLVFGIGGQMLGGTILGATTFGIAGFGGVVGGIAGMMIGQMLFPPKQPSQSLPKLGSFQSQTTLSGNAIPIVEGTCRVAGNIVILGDSHPYTIVHKTSGGKGIGGGSTKTTETRYKRSFLIAVCEGPATILRIWKGKEEIELDEATFFNGDGNSGLATVLSKEFAHYKNLSCVWFEEYELGNQDSIPMFSFEVQSGDPSLSIRDSFTEGIDFQEVSYWYLTDHVWLAQTFTPEVSYDIGSVVLKLFRIWPLGGNITVSIRATDAITGKPTGGDLRVKSVSGDITEDNDGEDITFSLDSYPFVAGTKYAIILKHPVAQIPAYINWKSKKENTGYPGECFYSWDAGATWKDDFLYEDGNFYFKTYGSVIPPDDMNPADILDDIVTNELYGGGIASSIINSTALEAVRAYCIDNDIEISMLLDNQQPLLDWIDTVQAHYSGYARLG